MSEQIVDMDTGEIVEEVSAASPLGATMGRYREACYRQAALELRLADRMSVLNNGDPEVQAIRQEMAASLRVKQEVEDLLAAQFTDRSGLTRIETPAATVTWGKARETWSLAHPPAWYGTPAALHELTAVFSGTAGATYQGLAQAVLAWLAPNRTVGELPPPRITLREEKNP